MNSKKILIVTSEFPPQSGGIGNHAYNLAVQLSQHNHTISVLTDIRSNDGLVESSFDAKQNFNVLRIKRHRLILWTYLKRIYIFKNFVKTASPTTIIASGKFSLWLVAFCLFKSNINTVAVIHGSEVNLQNSFQKRLVALALKKFNKIIAVSSYTKSLIGHLKLRNIDVIPNGFNSSKFKNQTTDAYELKGNPKLVTVGAVSQRKGQHNIINALPKLLKTYPKIHYHIVGVPSEKEKLMRLARDLKVEHAITFHNEVSQENLCAILRNSDIFVMLSEKTNRGEVEGFGIALLEANYMGIPTIGAKDCGIEDAIADYKSGILIHASSFIELKNAIDKIVGDKEQYQNNAKEWALQHTWELMIKKYIEVLININVSSSDFRR